MNLKSQFTKEKLKEKKNLYTNIAFETSKKIFKLSKKKKKHKYSIFYFLPLFSLEKSQKT